MRALAELLLPTAPLAPTGSRHPVPVTGRDREALLVAWLNGLLYLAEAPSRVEAATHRGLSLTTVGGGCRGEVILEV